MQNYTVTVCRGSSITAVLTAPDESRTMLQVLPLSFPTTGEAVAALANAILAAIQSVYPPAPNA